MTQSLIQIGSTGLNAAQYGLSVTGNNIANASTTGYSREVVDYSESTGQNFGAGYLGSGVNVVTVQRQYAEYLNQQLNAAVAQGGMLTTYNSSAEQLNDIVSDPTAGITTSLTTLASGLSTVANSPSDTSARAAALGDINSLTTQFNEVTQEFNSVRSDINTELTGAVSQINTLSSQIASLNKQIVTAEASSGQPANQLLDQRDAAVNQLAQLVGATTTDNADGSINVTIGNGQSLVNGQYSYNLTTVASSSNSSELDIAYQVTNSAGVTSTIPISESVLTSGTVGGLFQFRSQTLDPQQRALGNIAVTLATTMNEQNEAGVTLTGAQGSALFDVTQPTVTAATANTGGATITATYGGSTLSSLTGDNYTLTYEGGGNYSLQDTTTGGAPVTVSATADTSGTGSSINVDGLQIAISTDPAVGDSFQIQSDTTEAGSTLSVAITDGSDIAAGSPQATATTGTTNTGTGTITVTSPPAQYYPTGAMMQGTVTATVNATGTLDFAQTTTGDALPDVTVTVNGVATTYSPPTNVPVTAGATYNVGGVTFTMSGTPATGDTFTLTASAAAPSDNTNALQLANLFNETTIGSQTYSGAYSAFVGAIGDAESTSNTASQAQTTLISQVTQAQQSVSGVNLDEEAENMMTYEQMYQANSKVIQAASTIFDAIIGIDT
ncbi:flagellar hook-associated protein FlgK [Pararobbsia silviterrae]|uniref:Flagellar hook-associated protein 1 n=1 Tax=Pararobbsia silviterrae TaxID=1792498 RepID=A0A494X3T8_9BURK|nr:flagellar hook-associated protein FlgK [Pararobbsia silviterrae]RKP45357.1 flagellar hook-associated protein FlgK [Pararobbsia silviterrae]